MNALLYLRRKKLKNQLKSLLKKPARLIYAVLILGALALTVFGGHVSDEPGTVYRSALELNAIAAALYLLVFLTSVNSGFSRGGNLFHMSDVNLLFPSPIRPQTLLFHGLLQQMTSSLFIGIFILFQYTNLHTVYGISYGMLIALLLGYAAAVFLAQVLAMLIYSFTNGDEKRRLLAKAILYGAAGACLLFVLARAIPGGRAELLSRAVAAVNGTAFHLLPVVGWLTLAMGGLLTGDPAAAAMGLLACAAFFCLLVLIIMKSDPDYYEDVLKSAEIAQNAITAKKEGTMTEAVPEHVKLGRTGLGRGWGADAFYYKHRLENRRGRKWILGTTQLIFALSVIVFSVFMNAVSPGSALLLPIFMMAAYMQMFSSFSGRFNRELTRPYIYLIPEKPMSKMLWALAETVPSALTESLATFLPVGAILSLTPLETLACVAGKTAIAIVYMAADIAVERLWGGVTSKMLVFLLFFAVTAVLLAPGIVLVSVLAFSFEASAAALLLTLTAAGLASALLCLFLCRNMLQYAEMNYQ